MAVSGAITFVKRVFEEFSEKNVTFMAAGLAYNAFLSLAPILLLLFLVLGLVGGGLEERIVAAAGEYLPGAVAGVVEQTFQEEPSTGGASVVGLVVLVWGALKIFRGLDTAFSEIYETVADNSLVDKFRDGIVVLFALGLAVIATVGANAAFAAFADRIPFSGALPPLLLLGGLVIAFLPMYYVFPDAEVGVIDVLPGTVFAAVGWAVFQGVFQVYLRFSDPGAGSFAGGIIVVVIYLYFSSLVLLAGAVINAVSGTHSSGKPGGVGAGATSYETVRDESMDRDEVRAYLRGLTEHLTTTYEPGRPGRNGNPRRPNPAGDVSVTEYRSDDTDGDAPEWKVTLRWAIPDETASDRRDDRRESEPRDGSESDGDSGPDGQSRRDEAGGGDEDRQDESGRDQDRRGDHPERDDNAAIRASSD